MGVRQRIRKGLLLVSFLLFPVTIFYLSPALIVIGASKGIVVGSFIVFGSMFVGSLIFGRAFCGWLCPGGGIQETCMMVVDKKTAGGKFDIIKYLIWVPWISSIILVAKTAGGLNSIDFFYQTDGGISVSDWQSYVIYYLFVALIVILSLTAGRRAFCHYVCWMAPFMVIGSKLKTAFRMPSLDIRSNKERCNSCKSCERLCPMSLPVSTMVKKGIMSNTECIMCGQCIDTCKRGALSFSFGLREI